MAMNDLFKQKNQSYTRHDGDNKRRVGGFAGRFVSQLMIAGVIFVLLLFCYQKDNAAGEAVRHVVAMATADQSDTLAVSGLPFWQSSVQDDTDAENQGQTGTNDQQSNTDDGLNNSEADTENLDTSAAYTSTEQANGIIELLLPVSGVLSKAFGEVTTAGATCNGLIIGCESTQNVKAAAAGTITEVGGSAGNYHLRIVHNTNTVTVYDGLTELTVKNGDEIRQGDTIGNIVAEGELHFAVLKDGKPVDPLNYLESPAAN